MRHHFKLTHVEHLISPSVKMTIGDARSFTTLDGNFKYTELLPISPKEISSAFLMGQNDCIQQVKDIWERINSDSALTFSGQIELKNIISFGPCGLLLAPENNMALIGGIVNWGEEFARWYIDSNATTEMNLTWSDDRTSFELDLPDEIQTEHRPGLLMESPGQNVYGHWLLDYAPRLMLASLMHGPWINNLFFFQIPHWAEPILKAFGIDRTKCFERSSASFIRYQNAALPSGSKNGFRVSQPVSRYAWLKLKHVMLASEISSTERDRLNSLECKKIFVSRRSWEPSRVIENIVEIEDICRMRGYTIVRPEEFSLAGQAKLFNTARVVIGEDGSALHNIIFSDPGCRLGVISVLNRLNLWHMEFANSMGHNLSYVAAETKLDGRKVISKASFLEMLDRIES